MKTTRKPITDTRTTHDRHPAGRFSGPAYRPLVGPLIDAAGRAHITCDGCSTSATWNDAAAAGWKTASAPYSYTCPDCQ